MNIPSVGCISFGPYCVVRHSLCCPSVMDWMLTVLIVFSHEHVIQAGWQIYILARETDCFLFSYFRATGDDVLTSQQYSVIIIRRSRNLDGGGGLGAKPAGCMALGSPRHHHHHLHHQHLYYYLYHHRHRLLFQLAPSATWWKPFRPICPTATAHTRASTVGRT